MYGTMASSSSSSAAVAATAATAAAVGAVSVLPFSPGTGTIGPEEGGEALCHSYLQIIFLSIYDFTFHYGKKYGPRLLLLVVLSAIAAYRREMSCNRVFHDDGSSGEGKSAGGRRGKRERRTSLGTNEEMMADLLDGAGHLSGPLLAVCVFVWDYHVAMLKIWKSSPSATVSVGGSADGSGGGCLEEKRRSKLSCSTSGNVDYHDSASTSPNDTHARSTNSALQQSETESEQGSRQHGTAQSMQTAAAPASLSSPLAHLPPDTAVHILTYLHPRAITTLACVSRTTRLLVDDESNTVAATSAAEQNEEHRQQHSFSGTSSLSSSSHSVSVLVWKALWWRDYGRVLSQWDVGRMSMQRSVSGGHVGNTGADRRLLHPAFRHLESSLVDADICDNNNSSALEDHHSSRSERGEDEGDIDLDVNVDEADGFLPPRSQSTMKELYFAFAAGWVDYVLAGQNTLQRCLVGLHGHAYDITDFVESHPGSPETLLVQSGRDATAFFEDLGHSMGARRMALSMCAVMDRSCVDEQRRNFTDVTSIHAASATKSSTASSCGLCLPGDNKGIVPDRSDVAASRALASKASGSIPMARSKPRRSGCLKRVRDDLNKGRIKAQLCADRWAASVGHGTSLENGMLGSVRVYWDPLHGEWLAWHTNMHFQPEFLDSSVTHFGKT